MDPRDNPITSDNQTEPQSSDGQLAADVIRHKIDSLYDSEPNAAEEQQEVKLVTPRSKHQQFMYELTNSGKSLAEIQTDWHNYYENLPDNEKHEVWQEFYANHAKAKEAVKTASLKQTAEPVSVLEQPPSTPDTRRTDKRSVESIKEQILGTVNARGKLSAKHHLQSLLFGLGVGTIVVLIFLFGFFNERFIAPFITPSRTVSNTPIIIDPNNTAVSNKPEVIIPKINVEIPVIYEQKSVDEESIQKALEDGVVHYSTTSSPGEVGNTVIFGHSSNNILNKGKYKFAFVLLHKLEIGDTFMLTKDGKRYVYKVYEKKVIPPTDVSVLGPTDKTATATLITCDPPGTSINRLVVIGEQITPDPSTNTASTAIHSNKTPTIVPSNAPSLWQRILDWFRR